MKKATLIIVIDNFRKGGAEVLLVGILKELNIKYSVILVTLNRHTDFEEIDLPCHYRYFLEFNGKYTFLKSVQKLKKIVARHRPSIIHSHLFYSSLISRLACPKNIPFIFTVHNQLSKNVNLLERIFEKLTVRKTDYRLAVSEVVAKDYNKFIKNMRFGITLPNYVSPHFFTKKVTIRNIENNLKLVSIGNVKPAKNYSYLVNSFIQMKDLPVSLDIIGTTGNGTEYITLKRIIAKENLPIRFIGQVNNIAPFFKNYDAFISSSSHEGFGISVIEAMASGLPLLLSDIEVYREITEGNAIFFNIQSPESLKEELRKILSNKSKFYGISQVGRSTAEKYSKEKYLEQLLNIYDRVLGNV